MTDQDQITITVNGEERSVPAGLNVAGLVEHFKIRRETAIVEHNGTVVERRDYDNVQVQAGDVVELVRFVGGG